MPVHKTLDETYLLSQISQGDQVAFACLFHRVRDKLFFFILKVTGSAQIAEDVLQDVFTQLWQNRATAADIENFQAYLFKSAKNRLSTNRRRMALENLILAELEKDGAAQEESPEQIIFGKQLQEKIQAVVHKLPLKQRQVYRMTREQGLKQDTIAGILNISISTVKNHMTQALGRLRHELRHFYDVVWIVGCLAIPWLL